ncbi:MAG TPA: hypothetical protein VJQ59_09015 [Candidatus Sulfotelmatobacter sp.]|nr:hypothetical protein [Candidatus Sulfotelmatobacter sp.]
MNASHFWSQFFWLFVQGLDIVVALPKIRLAFMLSIIGLLVSIAWQNPFGRGLWKRYYSAVFAQFLFYPAIIAIGVLYRTGNPFQRLPRLNPFVEWTLYVLFGLSLLSGLFWVFRMRGLRWFALCLLVLQQILIFGALFVAEMSITGDWL